MKLNARQVESAKARDNAYKLADGLGMYLFVAPSGAKSWRLKYRFLGKEKTLTFGLYPAISLADARKKRDEAREQLAAGKDLSGVDYFPDTLFTHSFILLKNKPRRHQTASHRA